MPDGPGPVRTGTLFAFMVLAWSGNYLFVKVGLLDAPPLWLATLRAAVGAGVVAAYLLRSGGLSALDRTKRARALLLGVPNTALFLGLWFVAAGQVAVGEAAVVIYTYPIWVSLLAGPWLGHRPSRVHWAAVAGGFAGVVLVSEPWAAAGPGVPFVPFAELVASAVAWAVGTVLVQRWFSPRELAAANGYQLAGGSATLLAFAIVAEPGHLPVPTVGLGLSVLWLGVFGTAFAYIVWFWMLERHRAATVSAYLFLVPLGALGLGVAFRGEVVSLWQAFGIALVLVSIYAVARASASSGARETGGTRPVKSN